MKLQSYYCFYICIFATSVSLAKSSFAVTDEVIEGIVGQKVLLPCKFIPQQIDQGVNVNSELRVIWQKDRITLTFDHKKVTGDYRLSIVTAEFNSKNRFDLQLIDLKVSDAGWYKCVASYQDKIYTKNVTLVVKVPPKIDQEKTSYPTTVVEGSSLTLRCSATGIPVPNITWFKKVNLPYIESMNKEKIVIGHATNYYIANITRECNGIFICAADNGIEPAASQEIRVNVEFKPHVTLINSQISQEKGKMTMLQCRITSNPIQNYWWEFRGKKFTFNGAESCVLDSTQKYCVDFKAPIDVPYIVQLDITIKNLSDSDFGTYYCFGESRLGRDFKSAQLIEIKAPEPIFRPERPSTNPKNWENNVGGPDIIKQSQGSLTSAESGDYEKNSVSLNHSGSLLVTCFVLWCLFRNNSIFC